MVITSATFISDGGRVKVHHSSLACGDAPPTTAFLK